MTTGYSVHKIGCPHEHGGRCTCDDDSSSVRADVDRGLQVVGELKMLQEELELIEARLEAAGLAGEQVELNDPDREGRQFLARGSAAVVPVVFTADLLVKSFQNDSDVHVRIRRSLGVESWRLRDFFRAVRIHKTTLENGKAFRAKAAEILGKLAPAFISACVQRDKEGVAKSQTKIDWHRAEAIKAEGAPS